MSIKPVIPAPSHVRKGGQPQTGHRSPLAEKKSLRVNNGAKPWTSPSFVSKEPPVDLTEAAETEEVFIEGSPSSFAQRCCSSRFSRWTYFGAMLRLSGLILGIALLFLLVAGLFDMAITRSSVKHDVMTVLAWFFVLSCAAPVCAGSFITTARRLHDVGLSSSMAIIGLVNIILLFGTVGIASYEGSNSGITAAIVVFGVPAVVIAVMTAWFLSKDSEPFTNVYGPSPKYIPALVTPAQKYAFIQHHHFSEQVKRAAVFPVLLLRYLFSLMLIAVLGVSVMTSIGVAVKKAKIDTQDEMRQPVYTDDSDADYYNGRPSSYHSWD